MSLVTLEAAKLHLHITDPAADPEVTQKVEHASAAILDYLSEWGDDTWTDTTAPPVVQAMTLLLIAHYWRHRGDDFAPDDFDEVVWTAIARMFARLRDPAFA